MYALDMFEALERALDETVIPVDPDALAALMALRSRLDARIAETVDALERPSGWAASR